MPATKRTRTSSPAMTIETVTGEYGIPQPSIRIDLGECAGFRALSAAMHLVAARVELLSGKDRWCVQTRANDSYEHKGRVYLELAKGDAAECERGLAVLRAVADQDATAIAAIRTGA